MGGGKDRLQGYVNKYLGVLNVLSYFAFDSSFTGICICQTH